jgi:hypothetical protein
MEIRSQKEIRDWLECGKVTMASVARLMGCDPGVPADLRDRKTHMSMKHQARLSMIMNYAEINPEEFKDKRSYRPGKPLGQKRFRLWKRLHVMKKVYQRVTSRPAPHIPLKQVAVDKFEYRVRLLILKKLGNPQGLLLLDSQPVDVWYARCVEGAKRGLTREELAMVKNTF